MKPFNVCHNYVTKFSGLTVPKYAWYGIDDKSLWVCIHKEQFTDADLKLKKGHKVPANTLELYRFDADNKEWYLTIEHSRTTVMCCQQTDLGSNWGLNNPVEYPKYTGLHLVSDTVKMHSASYQVLPPTNNFKQLQITYENRHNKDLGIIPLDVWESAAPMSYADIVGAKSPNGKYVSYAKPY